MSFEPREYLRHILAETTYLVEHGAKLTTREFEDDETLRRAFVRSLEVIGEAVKQLPPSLTSAHPDVEWRRNARMRDRLIHGYFGVDYALVLEVVQRKVPELHRVVARILEESP